MTSNNNNNNNYNNNNKKHDLNPLMSYKDMMIDFVYDSYQNLVIISNLLVDTKNNFGTMSLLNAIEKEKEKINNSNNNNYPSNAGREPAQV